MNIRLIQGFTAILVLVSLLGFAACSKAPTDASISEAIKASYYSDPQLVSDRVDVSVDNGEVTLKGEVSSDSARLQANKLASETPGVRKVNDMLQLKPSPMAVEQQPPVEKFTSEPPRSAPKAVKRRDSQPKVDEKKSTQETNPTVESPKSPQTSATDPDKSLSTQPTPTPTPPAPPAPPPPQVVTIPSDTTFRVQMVDAVDSATNQVGEKFLASLDAPIVEDDKVILPKGTDVYVKLTDAKTSGRFSGRSELRLELDHLEFQGKSYPLESSTYEQVGASRGKDTAKKAAIGAAIGGAIGAIAGGGKGAAIGAGAGAGSGTAAQIILKGKQVQVPSETKLDFRLEKPLEVTVQPGQFKSNRSRNRPAPEEPSDQP
jgi:BON domain-containing protein/YmgG-like glycine-zipper protein